MLDWYRSWRHRQKKWRAALRAAPTPTWHELARQNPMPYLFVSGLLIAAEAGFIGLVAGFVINKNWTIDLASPDAYLWFSALAVLASVKRAMDRFIDTAVQRESDDDRFKQLIREVLDERPTREAEAGPSLPPR
jgi:hypothetical protein